LVPNPDFFDDENLYLYPSNAFVGFEVWQVKAGTIFDNILVTDDVSEATKFAELTQKTQEGEKKAFDKQEEEKKAKEEEEKKATEAAKTEEEDSDEKKEKDEL